MINIIIEELKKVKNFRGSRGERHDLWGVVTIIILDLLTENLVANRYINSGKMKKISGVNY
jgi:hypothetical protein